MFCTHSHGRLKKTAGKACVALRGVSPATLAVNGQLASAVLNRKAPVKNNHQLAASSATSEDAY